ncbi:MAG: electron transfer flavoprotein subunit alpha/FixB family protein [Victivallaceae bacterium]|nr:electron transfer flavoprotein subunit alpha/FixB family protein [Victivallaceae bacterium]
MAVIRIHQEKAPGHDGMIKLCPFGAIESSGGRLQINAACKMCRICVKKYPEVFEFIEFGPPAADKSLWRGVAVYIDHVEGEIHPVSFELLGKARELAVKVSQPVYCLMAGYSLSAKARRVLEYGADEVFVYDQAELEHFKIEPYTAVMEDFINRVKPAVMLVGGTAVGRSLAPRAAARFRTGLTADCTFLDIRADTDLDQIRPAFGGNIMAHINTPNHRPQFATVRYKIFSAPEKLNVPRGRLTACRVETSKLTSAIEVLEISKKARETGIEDAEVIVVAGRGLKKPEDLALIYRLADFLGAQVAGTRSLIETGWLDPKRQIGLSGRTVKPKLIITCGVSGAIQFVAGMSNSALIVAVNTDRNAPIFKYAHIGIVGDLYELLPELNALIENSRKPK